MSYASTNGAVLEDPRGQPAEFLRRQAVCHRSPPPLETELWWGYFKLVCWVQKMRQKESMKRNGTGVVTHSPHMYGPARCNPKQSLRPVPGKQVENKWHARGCCRHDFMKKSWLSVSEMEQKG